ncbi:MAG: type III secretion inner membrane ring lipoprotein SctJ [Parachlamydiales bacterium]|nr:type III secretion inner membrane ring lipoprotein SctJ [Parachlamydiales bacterium]
MKKLLVFLILSIFLVGCESNQSIVSSVDEKQANEIVVFLASKGIAAQKIASTASAGVGAGTSASAMYDIYVDKDKSIQAMSILNQNGLPRMKGTNLLQLFAGGGLMTTDKEETIRYQAGLEEELKNTIMKIDGVLDANVMISFPSTTEAIPGAGAEASKIKAAVYVKHQGILDDPNQHLESKIKRFVSGSIEGLGFDDVSVISDRSRLTDIKFPQDSKMIGPKALEKEYVKIWSITMTKKSASNFRVIFFLMIFVVLIFAAAMGYMIYKFYPQLKEQLKAKKTKPKDNE